MWRCASSHAFSPMKAIRLGRMTALSKPDGGVRGIVVGDFLRRLVAHTLAQQFSQAVLEATSPFQFAVSTKAGTEAETHALQALTSLDENATVVSIDGVGAFDLISRNAMVSGLMAMENGDRVWPFIRELYGRLLIYGRTIVGSPMTIPKEKAASKAIHSCRCSSTWVCTRA